MFYDSPKARCTCYTKEVMSTLESIILGLVQGLTEFIPISSSGHLVIGQTLLQGVSEHLFLEWINIGTVLALIIFFRGRIAAILQRIVTKRDYRLLRNLIVAALPAGLAGFLLAGFIENSPVFVSVWTVVIMLVIVGVVMIVLERLPKRSPVATLEGLSWQRALTIGLAQMLALIPGTSRSGATIVAGRLSGLSRAHAAEFSFLVSIPIMLGVLLKLVISDESREYFALHAGPLLLANVVAFAAGLLAVSFLMKFLEKRSLAVFGWYRVGLGLVITLVLLLQ